MILLNRSFFPKRLQNVTSLLPFIPNRREDWRLKNLMKSYILTVISVKLYRYSPTTHVKLFL